MSSQLVTAGPSNAEGSQQYNIANSLDGNNPDDWGVVATTEHTFDEAPLQSKMSSYCMVLPELSAKRKPLLRAKP